QLAPFPIFNLKTAGPASFYVPMASRVVLAVSGSVGKVFHLQADSQSIPPKRFYLGGTSSIRGFREDGLLPQDTREQLHGEVANCRALIIPAGCTDRAIALIQGQEIPSLGGELFTAAKTELRLPVAGAWDLGLFFETANLWTDPNLYRPLELRYSAGAGIRYLFPIGPAALDLGFNLDPDKVLNESTFQLHFSIGLFSRVQATNAKRPARANPSRVRRPAGGRSGDQPRTEQQNETSGEDRKRVHLDGYRDAEALRDRADHRGGKSIPEQVEEQHV